MQYCRPGRGDPGRPCRGPALGRGRHRGGRGRGTAGPARLRRTRPGLRADGRPRRRSRTLPLRSRPVRRRRPLPAEARARLLLGRSLADGHRLDEAALAVGRAKQLADACGAAHLGVLAVHAQRRIGGHRPRPGLRAPAHPALSEQERRIAELVGRGRSNRAIATELFISVKTVEGHLTRIFRKLHVTSRSGLTSALGLLDAA
ncbi:helix-turn-helix transcriptional regulator [Kitasatospora paranensis]|uniref:helix-turn-helix transcriptional regulator n=1 Tax=Kitasatospora paranensis TaxID=258053 RepID=UPI0031F1352C